MPWYRQGTVAITAGQNTVTGASTAFSANARVGDAFQGPDGRWYEVTNITSAAVLSILPAYQGPTVTGGSYGLAPMQGYVKESADRLRQIVNDWGSTLAGLGSVSVENVVPVAKGGTGGTSQATARSGLGLKAAALADILGTVSQSSGVPTGAILERGSNANGEYVRYADGTQICWTTRTDSATVTASFSGGYLSDALTWTFPVAFASPATVTAQGRRSGAMSWALNNGVSNASNYSYYHYSSAQVTASSNFITHLIAIGRWY